uniref:SHSP domain-containing protein n=1 Tax=Panagrellus redivivus TaxID=6233 RepID=A0A7E4W1G3_PANRE
MAPNAYYLNGTRRPTSSLGSSSPTNFSSGYQSSQFSPNSENSSNHWRKSSNYERYYDNVNQVDRLLEKLRESPSKIINEKRKFTAIVDMAHFRPEDIEITLQEGRLTIRAEQEVPIDGKTSVVKVFIRKFSIPNDVRHEMVATELSPSGILKITALRNTSTSN